MERNFKGQTFRKPASAMVKALLLRFPSDRLPLFPWVDDKDIKRLLYFTVLGECIYFLDELAKIMVELFVFMKNAIFLFSSFIKNIMKKESLLFALLVLFICFKANGQRSPSVSEPIELSQSKLVTTGQDQEDKNVILNDSFAVKLSAFLGQSTGNENVLTWSTVSEINTQGFELERMEEGESQFVTVDFIEGNGTSLNSNSYEYIDAFAGNAYYRLKQINISGTYEYSKAIYVESSHIEKIISPLSASTVLVYPYPASSYINIEVKADDPASFNVRVMDMMGKEFYCPVISKNASGKKITIGTGGLNNGMYLLVIQNQTTSIGKKIFLETN